MIFISTMMININNTRTPNSYDACNYRLSKKQICKTNSIQDVVSFTGTTNVKPQKTSILKKLFPYLFSGAILTGSVMTCQEGNKITTGEKIGTTNIEYVNVSPETQEGVSQPIRALKSQLNTDNDFLKGVEIDITDEHSSLKDDHSFKTFVKNDSYYDSHKGLSFYSDKNLKKVIVIQENTHGFSDKIYNYTTSGNYSNTPSIRQTLMHEVGHLFDQFFGHDHNEKFALKWDSLQLAKEKDPNVTPYDFEFENVEEEKISDMYFANSDLSDKDEFKNAIQKDFEGIKEIKKNTPEKMPLNIDYYTQDVDFTKPITKATVDAADYARGEVYANLFSYAMGENDGDAKDFVNAFKNSYKVVKENIGKYIHIKVK